MPIANPNRAMVANPNRILPLTRPLTFIALHKVSRESHSRPAPFDRSNYSSNRNPHPKYFFIHSTHRRYMSRVCTGSFGLCPLNGYAKNCVSTPLSFKT